MGVGGVFDVYDDLNTVTQTDNRILRRQGEIFYFGIGLFPKVKTVPIISLNSFGVFP